MGVAVILPATTAAFPAAAALPPGTVAIAAVFAFRPRVAAAPPIIAVAVLLQPAPIIVAPTGHRRAASPHVGCISPCPVRPASRIGPPVASVDGAVLVG